MDTRAAKLELARKKLKDHQDKKLNFPKNDISETNINHSIQSLNTNCFEKNMSDAQFNNTLSELEHDKKDCVSETSLIIDNPKTVQLETNVNEILISSKQNLEFEINDLKLKLSSLEESYNSTVNNYKSAIEKIVCLENNLENINHKFLAAEQELIIRGNLIEELNTVKKNLCDENSNFQEQLEFTKSILKAKEVENNSLHSQLYNLQNEFDTIYLQLQQLTNGASGKLCDNNASVEQTEYLKQKIINQEQQLRTLQKERDQINLHYEHYTNELNDQLRSVLKQNGDLTREVESLSHRENSLVEQISEMEIRLQNLSIYNKNIQQCSSSVEHNKLLTDFQKVQDDLQNLNFKHAEIQKLYSESLVKIKELEEIKEPEDKLNISVSKLNADIASDKIAAQIATEQNKKLKEDVQRLEEAFIKMSKDKLELTEKLTAEKYLTRELTLKLADVEDRAKVIESKLKAKDGEMIRLLANYRDFECKYEELLKKLQLKEEKPDINSNEFIINYSSPQEDNDNTISKEANIESLNYDLKHEKNIEKDDAMKKLQERFLKIMEEVAALSDEKHCLEHIILQLQNETDTICEYVALYQQQRSLLKRRDEERSAQMKLFQSECERLRNQLDELTRILISFVEDKDLSLYFQVESKQSDKEKVMRLLSNLKTNSLIDPTQNTLDFKNFSPCNCCSGKLIEI